MKYCYYLIIFFLVACSTHQPIQGNAIDEINAQLHQDLHHNEALSPHESHNATRMTQALMPKLSIPAARTSALKRHFDIAVKDVPAPLFYMSLVKGTPTSIIVSPKIKGKITLSMKNVTVEQVLQALEDTYGYYYRGMPGGYEIIPNEIQTQIYAVDYLELQRSGTSNMRLSSGEVTEVVGGQGSSSAAAPSAAALTPSVSGNLPGTPGAPGSTTVSSGIGRVETRSAIDFWKQLQATLEKMIGTGADHNVTVNPVAGAVVVRALPKEQKQVEAYLDLVQNNMQRQVILEAKVLEVTLRDQYELGIDWRLFGAKLNAITDFPGTDISLVDFPDAFDIKIQWAKEFTTTIRALETQGNIQVLSSPRVATMNNQKALIKVGDDEFFVTNLVPNTVVAATATSSTSNNNNNFTPSFTPIFSGVTLDVTPQIDLHNNITLHIHPTVSAVKEQIKSFNSGDIVSSLPMAKSSIRESDTIVHAKNGQVVIIGGLMQNQSQEDIAQMPYFGNIPFLGTVFRNTKQQMRKTELVILLKATVSNKKTNNVELDTAIQRVTEFKRGFHFGARPDIYGNEGEVPIRLGPDAGALRSYPRRRVS